jgi:PhoPQ-activated pathogenicity-related protein
VSPGFDSRVDPKYPLICLPVAAPFSMIPPVPAALAMHVRPEPGAACAILASGRAARRRPGRLSGATRLALASACLIVGACGGGDPSATPGVFGVPVQSAGAPVKIPPGGVFGVPAKPFGAPGNLPAPVTSSSGMPLHFQRVSTSRNDDVELRRYVMSIDFSAQDVVRLLSTRAPLRYTASPRIWRHDVDMYVPDDARPGRALVLVNNGVRHQPDGRPRGQATDYPENVAREIARAAQSVVISVSDVPNQFLRYAGDVDSLREDDAVARSAQLFLDGGGREAPLLLPMALSVRSAMDLAQHELAAMRLDRFVVSGISKRGWAAWLAAGDDRRIDAVVPFGADVPGLRAVLEHTRAVNHGTWPAVMQPYAKAGVFDRIVAGRADDLLALVDPLPSAGQRGDLTKFIVVASGDEVFPPDSTQRYFDTLKGPKAMRVIPNAGHEQLRQHTSEVLVPLLRRMQQGRPVPNLTMEPPTRGQAKVVSSEPGFRVQVVSAHDLAGRDFRYGGKARFGDQRAGWYWLADDTLALSRRPPATGSEALFVQAQYTEPDSPAGFPYLTVTTPLTVTQASAR